LIGRARRLVAVPAEVRKKLGVGPGSTLEWTEENGKVVITRGGRFNFNDVRTALFGAKSPKASSLDELMSGLREHIRRKRARD
jgi:AbrB family looped-hinge helix DNA binding protein